MEIVVKFFFFPLELICTDPGNIQHGTKYHDGFESGKKVKYSCLPGFTMEGSSTLTCTRTGVWDRVKPSCTCKRTNKQAFRYCRKSCNPDSSSCSKDKECVCDEDCGYSCLPKGLYFVLNDIFVTILTLHALRAFGVRRVKFLAFREHGIGTKF